MFSLPDKYKTNKKLFVQCDMIRCELRVVSYELRVAIRTTSCELFFTSYELRSLRVAFYENKIASYKLRVAF